MVSNLTLSPELWKMVLEFTSICRLRVMDYVLTEETCEMGERGVFDEELDILQYRPVSRVFADCVLEMIISLSIPQDSSDSRSGRLLQILLSRPTALREIDLYYPSDRIILPSPLDSFVWEHIALCGNLRQLTIDQYSHLTEANLRTLSERNGKNVLSLTFCNDISDGMLNLLPEKLPTLEFLELQAKSADQLINTQLLSVPDMSKYLNLKVLIDRGMNFLPEFYILRMEFIELIITKHSCFSSYHCSFFFVI